ncbi:MAG: 4,5-DOPA dioxygenase extradiol [Collinsella sp.]|nr:4,5-DOPA dioxygenase extradiol [Collinsella sp.]
MEKTRMPVLFVGHGSPLLALEDNEITQGMAAAAEDVVRRYGRPRAILAISAHWFTRGTFVQSAKAPRQVYDMYGFPRELYELTYPVSGSAELTDAVRRELGDAVQVNDDWGIDHGTWSVLVHMFPEADIPVVQLSVDGTSAHERAYEIGRALAPLRDEGYLIVASGNVVHNLQRVDWEHPDAASPATLSFNERIIQEVTARNDRAVIDFERLPNADYAAPTPDHFLPLLYTLGASEGEPARVFNNISNMGSMSMTGFVFEPAQDRM